MEAELLRRGWIASNVNASVKNVADFDIFALKSKRSVKIRVKTCSPGQNAFQFSGRLIRVEPFGSADDLDFAVLVAMGLERQDDEFFVLPTRVLVDAIHVYKREYLAKARRDGGARKDTGHWTLHLPPISNGESRANYDFGNKWSAYKDGWRILD